MPRMLHGASGLARLTTAGLMLVGCVGELRGDLEDYRVGGGQCDAPHVLASTCGAPHCHGGDELAAGLDLASAGVESRLVDVGARESGCEHRLMVVSGDLTASYFLEKLESPAPECGDPMPMIGALSPEELECVRSWVASLSGVQPGAADAAPAGGADAR